MMMDLAQIEEVFSDNKISVGSTKISFLITIGEYVPYTLKIDENNLEYSLVSADYLGFKPIKIL